MNTTISAAAIEGANAMRIASQLAFFPSPNSWVVLVVCRSDAAK
jgi:hypothetical protein